jgi:hypothetical protein
LVISSARAPSAGSAVLSVRFFDRDCEFSFGDSRALPKPQREELAAKYGDTFLCLDFSSELLVLVFMSLDPA